MTAGLGPALLALAASGALLVGAGAVLTRAADTIAERTGMGRLWIGAVLLASTTSLPELATDVSAVRLGVPDLAAGDLFGSSMANMLILAVVGLLARSRGGFPEVRAGHMLTACLAISLNAAAGAFVLTGSSRTTWPIGVESILLAIGFLAGLWVVQAYDGPAPIAAPVPAEQTTKASAPATLRSAVGRFALAALVVLLAAPPFAGSAERIAVLSGLGASFVGTLLVGLSTSLPELVTALAALRIGAVDLAIGNLFGSNAFNMAVFVALDLVQPGGSIFGVLDPVHALSALLAVMLTAVGAATVALAGKGRASLLEPASMLIILMYLGGLVLLYGEIGL